MDEFTLNPNAKPGRPRGDDKRFYVDPVDGILKSVDRRGVVSGASGPPLPPQPFRDLPGLVGLYWPGFCDREADYYGDTYPAWFDLTNNEYTGFMETVYIQDGAGSQYVRVDGEEGGYAWNDDIVVGPEWTVYIVLRLDGTPWAGEQFIGGYSYNSPQLEWRRGGGPKKGSNPHIGISADGWRHAPLYGAEDAQWRDGRFHVFSMQNSEVESSLWLDRARTDDPDQEFYEWEIDSPIETPFSPIDDPGMYLITGNWDYCTAGFKAIIICNEAHDESTRHTVHSLLMETLAPGLGSFEFVDREPKHHTHFELIGDPVSHGGDGCYIPSRCQPELGYGKDVGWSLTDGYEQSFNPTYGSIMTSTVPYGKAVLLHIEGVIEGLYASEEVDCRIDIMDSWAPYPDYSQFVRTKVDTTPKDIHFSADVVWVFGASSYPVNIWIDDDPLNVGYTQGVVSVTKVGEYVDA